MYGEADRFVAAHGVIRGSDGDAEGQGFFRGSGYDAPMTPPIRLFRRTPLVESEPAAALLGRTVYFKLENLQPTGSFKQRGVGALCRSQVQSGARHLVCSSGGNAGYAAAWAARALDVAITVVVPMLTGPLMRGRIAALGGRVVQHGEVWDRAHDHALELAEQPGYAYVHPFEHSALWAGHATMVEECAEQLGAGIVPSAVVVAVGGGGLLCGVVEGMHRVGWTRTPVLAVETSGAASFAAALEAGRIVAIPAMTSLALTLGAKRVTQRALYWAERHPLVSQVVTDRDAVEGASWMLDAHRMLVEPACGAALSALRSVRLRELTRDAAGPVLVIVCGGAAVTPGMLASWLEQVAGGVSAMAVGPGGE